MGWSVHDKFMQARITRREATGDFHPGHHARGGAASVIPYSGEGTSLCG